MTVSLTHADLDAIREIDTPTICNLIEMVAPERRGSGYTVQHLHCLHPEMKPIVGYAKTATMRARVASNLTAEEYDAVRRRYFEYLEDGDRPKVSIIQDVDERPGYGPFWGEVMTRVHKGLGCVGVVTNGSVRDVDMLAPDFQMLAGLIAPSHAFGHACEWGCEVNIHGMTVHDGDLIHADQHGAVTVPPEAVKKLPKAFDLLHRRERLMIDAAESPDVSAATLVGAWRQAAAIKE
jgi:regulator of RNase E activity RraA